MEKDKFSILKRIKSFGFAMNGIKLLLKHEHNSRIHLVAATIAVFMGVLFHISQIEWIIIVLVIGGVFTAELLNSALENLADRITKEQDPTIKTCKDLAAGAVLVMSIVALIIGLIIFLPKIVKLF